MKEWITNNFGPSLHVVFDPINSAFDGVYMPWARIAALSLFIGTMLWVYTLKKEYVNLDAPNGIRVNESAVLMADLKHGDTLEVGDHRFQVIVEETERNAGTYVLPED